MKKTIKRLSKLFSEISANSEHYKEWKNIPLAREAFDLMKSLPDTVAGEFETPEDKAELLGRMLESTTEKLTPRFALEVRSYMDTLHPEDADNLKAITRLRDFINPELPMADYCKTYNVHLLFDPVERTEEWERVIYDVEKALDRRFRFTRRHMGFCFRYWMAKEEELAERGITWDNPHLMNPHVMFN